MKRWYLIAYDIRDARRLQRVHYFLRKQATALQNSVFLVWEAASGLQTILNGVRQRADTRKDDIRLYPVTHPGAIWAAGKQSEAMSELYAARPKQARRRKTGGLFKRLFHKGEKKT